MKIILPAVIVPLALAGLQGKIDKCCEKEFPEKDDNCHDQTVRELMNFACETVAEEMVARIQDRNAFMQYFMDMMHVNKIDNVKQEEKRE